MIFYQYLAIVCVCVCYFRRSKSTLDENLIDDEYVIFEQISTAFNYQCMNFNNPVNRRFSCTAVYRMNAIFQTESQNGLACTDNRMKERANDRTHST